MTTLKLDKKWTILPLSLLTMGIAMPSCPGQQEMQDKITALQTANTDLTKKVQTLNQQLTSLNNDMNQVKQILPQMTNLLTTQKATLDQLDATVKTMQSKKSSKKK